jgi:hypothetical protein
VDFCPYNAGDMHATWWKEKGQKKKKNLLALDVDEHEIKVLKTLITKVCFFTANHPYQYYQVVFFFHFRLKRKALCFY